MSDLMTLRVQEGGPYSDGITYRNYEFHGYENGRAAYECGDTSIKIDAVPSLVIAEGQYKYGAELLANVYLDDAALQRIEPRNNSRYVRLQVWIAPADNIETAEALEHMATQIRANAAAKEHYA